jgi:hypothetical protein
MTPSTHNRVVLVLIAAVTVVGVIDGVVSGDADVVALFALVLLGLAIIWARISWHRPAVPVRSDLVTWMEERAIEGGESVDSVVDRAVAAYRSGLTTSDHDA